MGKFDEILDDVLVNAKTAASVVSKKATYVYGSSKQKLAAAEIRGEINKKLKELGALTYKSHTASVDCTDEILSIVNEITELKENLDTINQNLASAKNQKKCPQCEANVPKNSLFCNICGAKLEDEVYADDNENQVSEETVQEVTDNVTEENDSVNE
ncbi:MAG: zinc ribbon domain-containing protein [Ruminococcus sp.]|nr:zinc ribbon domain-containing protein [Ruminococcus sp.]